MSNIHIEEKIKKLIIGEYPSFFEELFILLEPAIGIKTKTILGNMALRSKYGGIPDVPENFEWPTLDNSPLSFICQINLSDLKMFESFSNLPQEGMLYFFLLTKGLNRYPNKKGEYKVIYIDKLDSLYTSSFSSAEIDVFKEANIDFYYHYNFPSYQSYQRLDELPETNEKIEHIYDEICKLTNQPLDSLHQMLGHPQALQGSVSYWWAFNYLNFSSDELNSKEKIDLRALEVQYVLLLQIDFSDENTSFSDFGGTGVAYFGINTTDLKKHNFDDISLVIQNT